MFSIQYQLHGSPEVCETVARSQQDLDSWLVKMEDQTCFMKIHKNLNVNVEEEDPEAKRFRESVETDNMIQQMFRA